MLLTAYKNSAGNLSRVLFIVDGVRAESNICLRIPGLVGPLFRTAHLLSGDVMVSGETSLSKLGVKGYACIQLVFDSRFPK